MLKIKNLKKYFGGVRAVDGASFNVSEGKITALIGPNGSGKTTIFNLISGILKADFGSIGFEGEDLTKLFVYRISNLGISRLFQQTRLFDNLSVRDNLLLALNNENMKFWKNLINYKYSSDDLDKVKEIAKLVGIESFMNKLARDLSYGQKRLVEIGRAIVKPHKLLMLDEPVAGVNPKLRDDISKLLVKLRDDGETILLIEHDMNFTLGISDHVVVMDEGKVISEGSPRKVKNDKKVLEAYLGE
ncbi:ABC transporter ATP-binding protein [Candidatus Pacearchaeota archaeon]|nr:ABC transporter ATP-binding protein [Candidatus Pacearchaeota archaeon]